ncbi:MAG: glycosyltransferase [Flavobacteriales bacterium]|nr:glycosyltransferase [Flavobacteriales bacterium]
MKIALLSAFYPFRGGIAQFGASLYRELEKEHDVKAYTFTRQYPDFLFPGETQTVTDDDSADPIPALRTLDSINPLSYRKTAREINDFGPDVLIVRLWMSFFGPAMGTVARLMKPGTKVVAIVDNAIPHEKRFFDRPFTRYLLKHVDGYIVMTEAVKRDLLSLQPPSRRIEIIGHPVYTHFGQPLERETACVQLGIDPLKKTLLFFGFIREYKGLDVLLQAFAKLDSTYQLVIAGESYSAFDEYQKQIDENPNRERIHLFRRYISDDEVPAFFCASHVCVLPYKSATQSGIASISFHFDLPMIVTNVGGLSEAIHHNENGLLVDRPDAGLISEAVGAYFKSDAEQRFRQNIRLYKREHSWEQFASRLVRFCETLNS